MCPCGKISDTLNESLKNFSEENLLKILLYEAEDFTSQMNSEISKCTIKFIKKTDCFSGPLFFPSFFFYFSDQVFSV